MRKNLLRLLSCLLSAALLLGVGAGSPAVLAADTGMKIVNPRTDYQTAPLGIDTTAPVFSWEMQAEKRGVEQTHYQLVVKKDAPGGAAVWDSGKVADGRSANIAYAGETLQSQTVYYWTVKVWDNQGGQTQSETARFETGLYDPADWSDALWLKHSTEEVPAGQPDKGADYTYAADFQIIRDNFSLLFSAADPNNYFMWAVNTNGADHPYLRRHVKVNGNYVVTSDVPLPPALTKDALTNSEHRIVVARTGNTVTTSIDDTVVDTYADTTGTLILGEFGFRIHNETGRFDNVRAAYTAEGKETVLFETGFEGGDNPFAGGQIVDVDGNGKLLVTGDSEIFVFQKKESAPEDGGLHYVYEADFQIIRDNMGLSFAAKDLNNFFMWAINTNNASHPYLRRHIFVNGSATGVKDITLPAQFTKEALFNEEHHIVITVEGETVTTAIDGVTVDTYKDTTGNLCEGYYGFRFFNEDARFDNVKAVSSKSGEPVAVIDAGFDDGVNPFDGGKIVEVDGDAKLLFTTSSETKIFESRMADSAATAFRKDFTAQKEIASARVYYSALGVSDLYINGRRVGTPTESGMVYDELKPGWTDYDDTVFYLTYDVTDLVRQGANAIGAEVASGWYNGVIAVRGHTFYSSQPNGLRIKLDMTYTDGSKDTVITDTSWQTSRDGAVTYADIYNGETYDARRDGIETWSQAGYKAEGWISAKEKTDFKGKVIAAIGSRVQARPRLSRKPVSVTTYQGVKDNGTEYGEIDHVQNPALPFTLQKGETAIFDLGQNIAGWEKFTVKGKAGTAVNIRFGEMLNDSGDTLRKNDGPKGSVYNANYLEAKAAGQYIMKGDAAGETYNPRFTFYGFRYIQVTAAADIEILDMDGVVVGNANEESSSLVTSDPAVNQLYSNILWGMRDNFLSTATDCPQRNERLGWTADTHIFSRTATYSADVAGFYRKWLQDMRDSQFGSEAGNLKGAYPDIAPNTHIVGGGNGGWAEAGIIVPYNVYLMYGDVQLIRDHFASMETFMDYMATRGDDQWQYNGGGAASGDWVSPELNDDAVKRYISVTYYAYAAKLMSEMAEAIGDTGKQRSYLTLYNNIKKEFNTRYVNADGSLKVNSQTTYLLALKLDLFETASQRDAALEILLQKIKNNGNRLSTGFIGTSILNQTLSDVGADDMAYTLLLQRNAPSWLYSVDQGATTIWENWDSYTIEKGFKDPGMNSFNHYAYGAVGEWMYRYMGGIEADPAQPGFKHIILQPTLDQRAAADIPEDQERMTAVTASYGSIYGQIDSAWTADENGKLLTYKATVPANTTATLSLPVEKNTALYEGGRPAAEADGVTYVGYQNGKAVYRLASGSYAFSLTPDGQTVETVTVTAGSAFAVPGKSVRLTARVTGSEGVDQTVVWSVTGGGEGTSVGADGTLTLAAGETARVLTLTATPAADPSVSGSLTLPVRPLGDLNGDGQVTIQDVMEACKVLARKSAGRAPTADEKLAGDMTGSDDIAIGDVMEICKVLARQA
ncbi:MAG: family 78 glycoside hydrolase catalytic domain [Clostridiales bacterium]|nr:family 78 glycoside hydrolase catalytic domain [Clostridiales bacterium]